MDKKMLLALTADIVAAHASTNELSKDELLAEIQNVFAKLASLEGDTSVPTVDLEAEAPEAPARPAVPLEAAFGADKVFCMICGKGMKTLKRHLGTSHGLKPGQYRKQFGIPAGTPLVAKNYSDARKAMADKNNLADVLAKARATRMEKKAVKAAPKAAAKGKAKAAPAKAAPAKAAVKAPRKPRKVKVQPEG